MLRKTLLVLNLVVYFDHVASGLVVFDVSCTFYTGQWSVVCAAHGLLGRVDS